jgi:hypothetical protein
MSELTHALYSHWHMFDSLTTRAIMDEQKPIDQLETWEILCYLRFSRNHHLLVNFTREMYTTEFNLKFSDEEWEQFLMYCDGVDNQAMFNRAEKYVNQWKGDYLLRNFLDKEG